MCACDGLFIVSARCWVPPSSQSKLLPCCESSRFCSIQTSKEKKNHADLRAKAVELCAVQKTTSDVTKQRVLEDFAKNWLLPVSLASNCLADVSRALKLYCPDNAVGRICNQGKRACKSSLPLRIISKAGNILLWDLEIFWNKLPFSVMNWKCSEDW